MRPKTLGPPGPRTHLHGDSHGDRRPAGCRADRLTGSVHVLLLIWVSWWGLNHCLSRNGSLSRLCWLIVLTESIEWLSTPSLQRFELADSPTSQPAERSGSESVVWPFTRHEQGTLLPSPLGPCPCLFACPSPWPSGFPPVLGSPCPLCTLHADPHWTLAA